MSGSLEWARVRILPLPLAAVLVALLSSGCLGDGAGPISGDVPADGLPQPWAFLPSSNVTTCDGECFEPAVAVDQQGRVFAIGSSGRMDGVAVSVDGGKTFTVKPWPALANPVPGIEGEAGSAGDDVVQVAPWGTMYMTRLYSDTGGILGGGIQLVASDDAGDTWTLNHFVQVREMPASRSFTADRQWLAFDGNDTVYLVFNCGASALICAMRSDDRGATWSPSYNVVNPTDHNFPSPAGFPAVGPDGSLLVAYFGDPRVDASTGARSIKVASSTDRGITWRQSTAYTHPGLQEGTSGGGWPEATILADGTWVAGWSTSEDLLMFTTSTDQGATWSEPLVLTPEQTGGASHPWLRARQDGGFDAVWFGSGPKVVAGRFTANLSYELATVAEEGGGNSDYSFFAHTADGRVAVAYVKPDGALAYAATNR